MTGSPGVISTWRSTRPASTRSAANDHRESPADQQHSLSLAGFGRSFRWPGIGATFAQTMFVAETAALKPISVLPFAMLILMTGFELGVAFLQADIFTFSPPCTSVARYIRSTKHSANSKFQQTLTQLR